MGLQTRSAFAKFCRVHPQLALPHQSHQCVCDEGVVLYEQCDLLGYLKQIIHERSQR